MESKRETFDVLLIEDDTILKGILEDAIHVDGHRVISALSEPGFLKKTSTEPYDAVIIDVDSAGAKGVELLGTIKHRRPDIIILAITPAGKEEKIRSGLKPGADRYMEKPIEIKKITEFINQVKEKRLS